MFIAYIADTTQLYSIFIIQITQYLSRYSVVFLYVEFRLKLADYAHSLLLHIHTVCVIISKLANNYICLSTLI